MALGVRTPRARRVPASGSVRDEPDEDAPRRTAAPCRSRASRCCSVSTPWATTPRPVSSARLEQGTDDDGAAAPFHGPWGKCRGKPPGSWPAERSASSLGRPIRAVVPRLGPCPSSAARPAPSPAPPTTCHRRGRSRGALVRAAPRGRRPPGHGSRARGGPRRPRRPDRGLRASASTPGPTVLTMPDLIHDAFDAVGEDMDDWLDLVPVEPLYRAFYPDGSQLDVHSDVDAMAAEIERVISPAEADGLPPLRRLRLEALPLRDARLHRHQHRLPGRPAHREPRASSSRSAASASSRRRCASTSTTRAPSGSSASRRCTPGSRRRTRSRSTRSSPTWTPSPGSTSPRAACTRCPAAMAGAAEKHGVDVPLLHRGHARRDARRPRGRRAHRRRRAHPGRRRRPQPRPARSPTSELLGREPWSVAPPHLLAVVLPAARRLVGDVHRRPRTTTSTSAAAGTACSASSSTRSGS